MSLLPFNKIGRRPMSFERKNDKMCGPHRTLLTRIRCAGACVGPQIAPHIRTYVTTGQTNTIRLKPNCVCLSSRYVRTYVRGYLVAQRTVPRRVCALGAYLCGVCTHTLRTYVRMCRTRLVCFADQRCWSPTSVSTRRMHAYAVQVPLMRAYAASDRTWGSFYLPNVLPRSVRTLRRDNTNTNQINLICVRVIPS